jgi:hypothetical protein
MNASRLSVLGFACGLLVGSWPLAAAAQPPVTLQAAADTSVRIEWDGSANTNWGCEWVVSVGTGRYGFVKPDGAADAMRGLARFDLSSVPPTAQIAKAVLELTIAQFGAYSHPGSTYFVDVHRVIPSGARTPWLEGRGVFDPNGLPGCIGVDPADGVAWLGAGDNPYKPAEAANNVTQPDLDPLAVASATIVHGVDAPGDVVAFDITGLVRDWVSGVAANHGVVLRDLTDVRAVEPPGSGFRALNFGAREGLLYEAVWRSRGVPVVAGPRLVITYADTTPPTVTCAPADGLWHGDNVSLACTAEDAGSGLADPADANFVLVTTVAAGDENANAFTGSRTVCDQEDNCTTAGPISGNKVDRRAPTLAPVVTPNPVVLNGVATATPNATDPASGVASQSCGAIDTSSVGAKSVVCAATDNAGNSASASANYEVVYAWAGFFQPVDNLPTLNQVKAGSAIPIKFSLGGSQGLAIFAAGYPVSRVIACGSGDVLDDIEQTVTAGGSSLSYDAASGQYHYVWKTDKAWAATCRQVVLRLLDGTEHMANFRLK